MLPLISRGDPGIDRPIVIDGIVLSIMPPSIDMAPDPVGTYQDMLDGGAREWQHRPHFSGIANMMDRYTLTIPLAALDGQDREKMELIRARGGVHRVTLWRMVPFVFTLSAGLQRYYLPRMRKCAPWLYSGLLIDRGVQVSTSAFPTYADIDGDPLVVTYAEGPTLAAPDAGGIVLARQPDLTGAAVDFTALRIADSPVGGEVLTLWTVPTFEMSLRAPKISISRRRESHDYTFVEL